MPAMAGSMVDFFQSKAVSAFLRDEKGATLVEFSLVSLLLFSMCFGIIQYGLMFFVWNNMFDAARQGARSMAVGTWNEAQAVTGATGMLATWPTGWAVVAEDVGTTGTNQVRMLITVPGAEAGVVGFLPAPAELRAEVIMRKE
jgi:Flp pilus assembly protein TadG